MNNNNIMFICHKHVVSKAVAALQVSHLSDVRAILAVSIMPALWEVVCRWAPHPALSTSGLSNTTTLQGRITTTTHENCMHAEEVIIILYTFLFYFLLYVFVLFSIVLQNNYCLHRQYFSILLSVANASNNSSFSGYGVLPQPEIKACKKIAR